MKKFCHVDHACSSDTHICTCSGDIVYIMMALIAHVMGLPVTMASTCTVPYAVGHQRDQPSTTVLVVVVLVLVLVVVLVVLFYCSGGPGPVLHVYLYFALCQCTVLYSTLYIVVGPENEAS